MSEKDRIELYKLAIARSDITEALYATRMFLRTVKNMQDEGFLSLQDGIVVSYARPFTKNLPYGALDKKWSNFANNSRLQKTHDLLIEQRNKISAHSDQQFCRVEIIPSGVTIIQTLPKNETVALQISTKKFDLRFFPDIEKLCFYLGSRLNEEVESILDRLYFV